MRVSSGGARRRVPSRGGLALPGTGDGAAARPTVTTTGSDVTAAPSLADESDRCSSLGDLETGVASHPASVACSETAAADSGLAPPAAQGGLRPAMTDMEALAAAAAAVS